MNLYPEDLEFINDAIEFFDINKTKVTYWGKDDSLIAFRWGADNDCIKVMRVEGEVAFVNNCLNPLKMKTQVWDIKGNEK